MPIPSAGVPGKIDGADSSACLVGCNKRSALHHLPNNHHRLFATNGVIRLRLLHPMEFHRALRIGIGIGVAFCFSPGEKKPAHGPVIANTAWELLGSCSSAGCVRSCGCSGSGGAGCVGCSGCCLSGGCVGSGCRSSSRSGGRRFNDRRCRCGCGRGSCRHNDFFLLAASGQRNSGQQGSDQQCIFHGNSFSGYLLCDE